MRPTPVRPVDTPIRFGGRRESPPRCTAESAGLTVSGVSVLPVASLAGMTTAFLVRHGQIAANAAGILRGFDSADHPLNETGVKQAEMCAEALASRGVNDPTVVSSTFLRARQTALIIARRLGVPTSEVEGLHEMDLGTWAGRPSTDLSAWETELLDADGDLDMPSGESGMLLQRRVRSAFDQVVAGPGTPIVISHGWAIIALLSSLRDEAFLPAWLDGRYEHGNTAVTELRRRDDDSWDVVAVADGSHLDRLEAAPEA